MLAVLAALIAVPAHGDNSKAPCLGILAAGEADGSSTAGAQLLLTDNQCEAVTRREFRLQLFEIPRKGRTPWPSPSASRTAAAYSASKSRLVSSAGWNGSGVGLQKLKGIRNRRMPPMFLAPTDSDIGSSPSCGISNSFNRSSRFVSASH
jgi:hypothetical protein